MKNKTATNETASELLRRGLECGVFNDAPVFKGDVETALSGVPTDGNSILRATIAGYEGLMHGAANVIEKLHPEKHDWLLCEECNTIERLRRCDTGIHGDD